MRFFYLLVLFILTASSGMAEPMPESDIPVRYKTVQISYEVNADGSYVISTHWSAIILKENALESFKKASVTFSTSVASGEVLDAYTLKKSGQRIDVPKNSYQVSIDDGYEKASPLYSDETKISVLFPDLAVGDTIVFSSRVTNREGMFPNQFSTVHVFSRFVAHENVSVEIVAPAAMQLNRQSFFMTEAQPVIKEGKQHLRWTYRNESPEKWTPADNGIATVGDEPSLYVSTFKSYREIVETYGARATPKAAVTERVKQLAAEITAGGTAAEAQASSLYDWVNRNISYGGNCIGIGAVVPRDLAVVLDNKMGDCKDHATLLQALLAARNIESEQVLINAGALYQLPSVPVVEAVNHVINYIPSLNLFLDSTSQFIPFGMLPMNLGEKPVLLVSHYREGLKTPSTAHGHEQVMKTTICIREDGTAAGTVNLRQKGFPAIATRAIMRDLPRSQEEFMAGKMLESQGVHGSATMQRDDASDLRDTYNLSLSINLQDFIPIGTATGFPVKPVAASAFPIDLFMLNAYEPTPHRPQLCGGGLSVEEYELEFPASMKILSVPKDFVLSDTFIDYTATYRKEANILNIRRALIDKTATNVCSSEYAAGYKKSLLDIAKDLKAQILIGD
jgi:hypothetical protein